MNDGPLNRITPWVGRLLAINAVVLLLQQTIFTSDALFHLVEFDPSLAFARPWTFVTYMFVHGGLWHLLANSLALFVFGPAVERRLGPSRFLAFYLYCGVGAAAFSLALWFTRTLPVPPFVGASGAILGLAYAFGRYQPEAQLVVFPLPMPIKAKNLVWLLAGLDVVGALFLDDNVAHFAHLGGLGFGWLFFAVQGIANPSEAPRLPSMRPRVTVPARGADGARKAAVQRPRVEAAPAPAVPDATASESAEIDRVLDKISASGIASLTAEERRFLDAVAERRRRDDQVH